jgi:mono/diheme cytochrome c family protein
MRRNEGLLMKKGLIPFLFFVFTVPTMALADGQADFKTNCIACHGGSGKTNLRRANILKIDPRKLYLQASEMNKDEMIAIIEKGKDKMPGFAKKLTKTQITDIVDYVLSLKNK